MPIFVEAAAAAAQQRLASFGRPSGREQVEGGKSTDGNQGLSKAGSGGDEGAGVKAAGQRAMRWFGAGPTGDDSLAWHSRPRACAEGAEIELAANGTAGILV